MHSTADRPVSHVHSHGESGSGGRSGPPPDVRLLHYNDVYHLDPSSAEPVGGVARFITVCKEYRDGERYADEPKLVTLFSGDVFNPSLESSVTKGKHMVPILNSIGTDCACVGNHDLDFGVKQYRYLTSKTNFPWLLANVLDPALGENVPLGNAKHTHMITTSNGLKIGLLGLGEREWLATVNSLPPDLIYRSATDVARELVPQLRAEGADMIVALTHMREPNDHKLAQQMNGDIDLILGGHDHYYAHAVVNGTHVLRSGSDFKQLSYVEARRSATSPGRWHVDVVRRDMTASIAEDADTLALVDTLTARLKKSLEKQVGWTAAPLDALFTTVRLRESNYGNFVCDLMASHYGAECAMMAAGTIRGNQIYAPGPLRVKDITDCFPFEDPVVVIKVSGKAIWEALENGVSLYPALEGRFPQVSNIHFSFDASKPVGSRVRSVEVGGKPLHHGRLYVLATRGYMARGRDGYTSLLVRSEGGECEEVVSEENGILISTMLRQYFMALKVLHKWTRWGPSMERHWDGVVSRLSTKHPLTHGNSKLASPEDRSEHEHEHEPAGSEARRKTSWSEWTPEKLRAARASVAPVDEDGSDSSDDDDDHDHDRDHDHDHDHDDQASAEKRSDQRSVDRELAIMRRVLRKWCRLAGVRSHAGDALREDEFRVTWTRAVAPRIEGRIRIIGEAAVVA